MNKKDDNVADIAYMNGHADGIREACERIVEVLDFKWDGSGILDVPGLDQIRIKIRQLQTSYERECVKVIKCGEATGTVREELSQGEVGWSKSYQDVRDLRKALDENLRTLRQTLQPGQDVAV